MIKCILLLSVVVFVLDLVPIVKEKKMLQNSLIRLHVVGASDSEADQAAKGKVRDAVVAYVDEALSHVMTVEEAKAWIRENLPGIESAANDVLHRLGLKDRATVGFQQEAFPARDYDTFSLPSGVYTSLRVSIGQAQGQNWWCVVFPSLCLPGAGEDTQSVAAGAGFSESLTNTLTGKQGYTLRFYFLDLLGKIENFLFRR